MNLDGFFIDFWEIYEGKTEDDVVYFLSIGMQDNPYTMVISKQKYNL